MQKNQSGECILLGVPKVEYTWEECTPFPSCLKACLNYMGQDISYAYLMAASGAAFRLRWSKGFWDGGNVDITYIYNDREDGAEAFRRSFDAAGREYRFLRRKESDKQGFIDFIKSEIDSGRPVIALGIIGPPEACIITGYQNGGDTLLGWNFFQHRQEYNNGTDFHESGYFISKNWWENECTGLLMSIGEAQNMPVSDRYILQNAINIVDRETIYWIGDENGAGVACGQEAYETWAEWTADDRQFGEGITLPLVTERFMCQNDAQTMVGEGRKNAAIYLDTVAERHPEVSALCKRAAERFIAASSAAVKMHEVFGGCEHHETTLRKYAERDARMKIVALIREAARCEAEAMAVVREIIEVLPE